MANRIDTFRRLRDTYVTEIGQLYDKERHQKTEIKQLEAQLVIARSALGETQAELVTAKDQLAGIRAVIRGMEDKAKIEARRLEDNTIASHRAIEDKEYGE